MFASYRFIHHLQQYEFIQVAIQTYRHIKDAKILSKWYFYPCFYHVYRINRNLTIPLHEPISQSAQKLLKQGISIGNFYLAQSLFLQNKLDEAEHYLSRFLQIHPYHSDGLYLLVEIKTRKNRKEEAFSLLENFLAYSKRGKTWQHLSNLVDNQIDFERFHNLFVRAYPNYHQHLLTYDLACHLTNAATRAKNTEFVLQFWREQYRLFRQTPEAKPAKRPAGRRYSDIKAEQALKDLKLHFDQAQINFFLISGTLLGCIREGKLLGHDKDIDIGVWETYSVESLANVIYDSGCFYVLPIYSPDILVIRHVNGVTIDIFIHHREANNYWHAGGKSKWHNSPFELSEYAFLGGQYLIPKDYDRYLTENYGDWRTPNTEFDSALDTPNMEIVNREAMLIYLYKRLLQKSSIKPSLYVKLERALQQYSA